MGAAAQDIFAMDRCDPAEILAVLDEVEAQLLVVDIDLFPVEGGNAEQMNLYITVRSKDSGIEEIVDILLKVEKVRNLLAICLHHKGAGILEMSLQGREIFRFNTITNGHDQFAKADMRIFDNPDRLVSCIFDLESKIEQLVVPDAKNVVITNIRTKSGRIRFTTAHQGNGNTICGSRNTRFIGDTTTATTAASEQGARGCGQNGHGPASGPLFSSS